MANGGGQLIGWRFKGRVDCIYEDIAWFLGYLKMWSLWRCRLNGSGEAVIWRLAAGNIVCLQGSVTLRFCEILMPLETICEMPEL